jgi:uncharacterized protein (TIGR02466 family)
MTPLVTRDAVEVHFPVLIMERQYEGVTDLNRKLAEIVRTLARTRKSWIPNNPRQYRAGFSTDVDFLDLPDPAVKKVRGMIEECLTAYVQRLCEAALIPLQDTSLQEYTLGIHGWSVILGEGDWICPHIHRGGEFSGVYYVEIPHLDFPEGCIEFINPMPSFSSVVAQATSETVRKMPQEGKMLVFPASYMHLVYPFGGPYQRIAVSFTGAFQSG